MTTPTPDPADSPIYADIDLTANAEKVDRDFPGMREQFHAALDRYDRDLPRASYGPHALLRLSQVTDDQLRAIGLTRIGAVDVVTRSLKHLPLAGLLTERTD